MDAPGAPGTEGGGGAAPAAKAPLVLPKEAQEAISTAVGQAIEALSAILDLAKGAQVSEDPAATVPPEFAEQIERVGMMVAALGDQYEGGEGAAPPPELDAEQMALAKQVAKSIGYRNVVAMAKIAKAGRVKMSFEQAMKLHHGLMAKLYDIISDIAPMIADFGGEVGDAFGGKKDPPAGPPPAPGTDPANKGAPPPAGGAPDATTAALARLEAGMSGMKKTIERVAKTRPAPATDPGARDAAPPPPASGIPYGENLSARVRKDLEDAKNKPAAAGAGGAGG